MSANVSDEARGHVEIRPRDGGGWHLFLDGTDIAGVVSTASVEWDRTTPHVHITLMPWRELGLDLPDAVLHLIDDEEARNG